MEELKLDHVSADVLIVAKAVVMATGSARNLYSLTTNLPGITEDGYALAYRTERSLRTWSSMAPR